MWNVVMPPTELLVLYGTWIIGYALVASLLMTEYKVLYQKPLLTLDRFLSDTNRVKDDAINQIEMSRTLALLEQAREKFLANDGVILKLFDKIAMLPGEDHPEAGAYLKKVRRLIQNKLADQREALIPMSDQQVVDKILDSQYPELAALVPRLKKIEGNIPIGELQDGLYHKVVFDQKIVKKEDDDYLEGSKKD